MTEPQPAAPSNLVASIHSDRLEGGQDSRTGASAAGEWAAASVGRTCFAGRDPTAMQLEQGSQKCGIAAEDIEAWSWPSFLRCLKSSGQLTWSRGRAIQSRNSSCGGDATYREGQTRIRCWAHSRCCMSSTGIRTTGTLVACWARCCRSWVVADSYSTGSREQVAQPGVADERCWRAGVAGCARAVEPVGGGDDAA